MTNRKYRVIHWGTGRVGMPTLRGILERPDFELVGSVTELLLSGNEAEREIEHGGFLDAGEIRPEQRVHVLELADHERNGRRALVCRISLFGGTMVATAQVTPSRVAVGPARTFPKERVAF